MPVLTDYSEAEIKRSTRRLYGMTLGRPALLVADGVTVVYAVDVNITERDPSGRIRQYIDKKNNSTLLTGLPGQPPEDWQLDDSNPGGVDTTLRNVMIARNNMDLIYAETGSAVVCERTHDGGWQVTGFSMERPGTHTLYPVDLGDMSIGTVIDLSIDARLLTLHELGTFQPFGALPFGAGALFEGGEFVRIL